MLVKRLKFRFVLLVNAESLVDERSAIARCLFSAIQSVRGEGCSCRFSIPCLSALTAH